MPCPVSTFLSSSTAITRFISSAEEACEAQIGVSLFSPELQQFALTHSG